MELTTNQPGIVYIVGAGPGDPGLITVRGKSCLEEADAVVYDRLCPRRLLDYAPKTALRIDAGKTPGKPEHSQEEINGLLVKLAREGKKVVRLKGGDPFLFGRGGEEALALKAARIPFEIVPGVTSAIAVPAYAGIPVTHRGIAAALTIITGHEMTEKDASQLDWEAIRKASQTLVVLMGTANLAEIIARLQSAGLAGDTPVAVIENGTTYRQRLFHGELRNILEITAKAGLKAPAVIVIGEVVRLTENLNWLKGRRPLLGKRILLTRPLEQMPELARLISEAGGEPLICPTIKLDREFTADIQRIKAALNRADWLVFTSSHGVTGFFNALNSLKMDTRCLHRVKVAAIGQKTARALIEKGILVDIMPPHFTSEGLLKELGPEEVKGKKVLLLRVNEAPPGLAAGLSNYGADVEEYPVYNIQTETAFSGEIADYLASKNVDAAVFTSPSTIKGLLENIQGDSQLLNGVKVVCIGPVTSAFAGEQKITVSGVAENSSNEELVKVLISVLNA